MFVLVLVLITTAGAGYDTTRPVVWLMEGLIGYLSGQEGNALLGLLHAASAPDSRLVMTCPPTEEDKQRFASQGQRLHHTTFEQPAATLARCAPACGADQCPL